MDRRTGEIISDEEFLKKSKEEKKNFVQMDVPPTKDQMARKPAKVMRNDPCPCRSGKKFKHCCLTGA
jgi:preprotein translocase subunit SecA